MSYFGDVIFVCALTHYGVFLIWLAPSGPRLALSDVCVLKNYFCLTGEYQGLVMSARPAPGYQELAFTSLVPM